MLIDFQFPRESQLFIRYLLPCTACTQNAVLFQESSAMEHRPGCVGGHIQQQQQIMCHYLIKTFCGTFFVGTAMQKVSCYFRCFADYVFVAGVQLRQYLTTSFIQVVFFQRKHGDFSVGSNIKTASTRKHSYVFLRVIILNLCNTELRIQYLTTYLQLTENNRYHFWYIFF